MKNPLKDPLSLALFIGAAVIGYQFFTSHNATNETIHSTPTPEIDQNQAPVSNPTQVETNLSPPPPQNEMTAPETGPSSPTLLAVQKSEEAVRKFSELAHLDAQLPPGLNFRDLDLDFDNMTAIYAESPSMNMAVVAGSLVPDLKDLNEFVRSRDTGIPNLDTQALNIESTISVPAVGGNGLQNGTLISGRTASGEDLRIAFMPRADGAGSYMVVLTAPANSVNANEEYFEELYKNFRAKPVKK